MIEPLNMKNTTKYLTGSLCIFFITWTQIADAQPHKKPVGSVKSIPVKENYITHEITKNGAGDHGLYYDTLANKLKPTDAFNAAGKQYQDIKVTLAESDVIRVDLRSEDGAMLLSLLNNVNGGLQPIKTTNDTSRYHAFKLLFKANAAGIYTLRVSSRKRVSKDKYERQYYYENSAGYSLNSVIATAESGRIMDSPTICDQLQFLMRQQLTYNMQITGAVVDTTMDVLDKKKIQSINHASSFTFYKNSAAKISIDPGSLYITFDQMLAYKDGTDAAQAQRYFISSFETCLGPGWTGATDTSDADWYKFKKPGSETISVILYRKYNYVEILL